MADATVPLNVFGDAEFSVAAPPPGIFTLQAAVFRLGSLRMTNGVQF